MAGLKSPEVSFSFTFKSFVQAEIIDLNFTFRAYTLAEVPIKSKQKGNKQPDPVKCLLSS